MQILHIANSDKPVEFYNLDAIISVGYRVKSKRGTQFRIWSTGNMSLSLDNDKHAERVVLMCASSKAGKC